jgi:hypothetical protein
LIDFYSDMIRFELLSVIIKAGRGEGEFGGVQQESGK